MKRLKLFFACLLMAVLSIGQVWADTPAAVGTTLFSEDFSSYSNTDVPNGSVTTGTGRVVYGSTNVTYTCANGAGSSAGTTKVTTENSGNLAGGASPELMVGKKGTGTGAAGGSFSVAGIPSGGAQAITVSFKQNKQNLSVSVAGTGYTGSISGKPGAAGERTFDVTVDDGADATFTLTFQAAATSNVRVDDILITVKTAGEGGAPAKTLSSIAVSGNPTKTDYYVGDEFDPAGLTVTGHYSDNTDAPITSGITWAYDPSQELALNQTSIGVTATVDEISSPKYNVTGLTVSAAPAASNWQVTDPSDLVTGDVVVLTMLKNNIYYAATNSNGATSAPSAPVVTVVNNKLSNVPTTTQQWTVTVVSEGVFQFAVNDNKLYCTNSNNGVRVGTETTNSWQVYVHTDNTVYLKNTATFGDNNDSRYLGVYNNADWRTYTSINNNIKDETLVIFREPASSKENAGLAYATEDAQKLVKVGAEFTAPTLSNDNNLTVTYTSDNTSVAEVDASTGVVTLKNAAGKAVITASSEETTVYKAGSASYTIYVAEQAGTDTDPLTEATAKALIDLGCTANAHVAGTVASQHTSYFTVTLSDGFQFYNLKDLGNVAFENAYLVAGDQVIAYGQLLKYNSTYELATGCYLTSYTHPTSKTPIVSDIDNPITVANAITYIDAPATYDLSQAVWVRGVVTYVGQTSGQSPKLYIDVKDANEENTFRFFDYTVNSSITQTPQVNDILIATGKLDKYNTTYELNVCEVVYLERPEVAVSSVAMTESTAEVEVGSTVTLHASILPENATNKTITWSVQSGSDYASVDAGVVTGNAEGEAVIRAASTADPTKFAECTVTVTPVDLTKHVVTFDATVDKGESPLSKSNITFTCSNGVLDNSSEYRLYKYSETTFACSDGNITKIEFTGVSGNPASGFAAPEVGSFATDGNNGVWTGNASSVTFTASNAQVRATEIIVTYKEDNRAASGLAWSTDAVELIVGNAFTAPTLSNPNGIAASAITIASDNTDLATVNEGVVSLVENATGEATITATFAGNDDYKPAVVSYTITVNAAAMTDYYEKVTTTAGIVEGTYLIVYEAGNVAFDGGLETLDDEENTIDVEITNDNKIGVTSTTAASTFYIDPTAGTIQAKSGKYIGVSSNSNGLKTSDNADTYSHTFAIEEGDAVITADFEASTMTLRYNTDSGQKRFRYYKTTSYPAIQLYKLANEVVKASSELAWSNESVELTIDGDFTAPTLSHADGITGTISYVSDNEAVATVSDAGEISLTEPHITGTAHITATYGGDENFKAGSAVCTIKVNPAHSIYVSPSLTVDFGNVIQDATVDDKVITVTLTGVPNATATLGGDNPEVFSIDPASPAALTASGDITISASSATAGTFSAKLTITDNAGEADSKVVTLKLTVVDPATVETAISTTSKWVAATAADLVDGAEVIITGIKDEVVYAMGEQKNTNRAACIATVDGEGVLTPGEGTMSFTLVAQETEGVFALRTSDGKFLYAAKNDANHLKTQDEVDVNAKWTLTVASAVAEGSSHRNVMQFNGGNTKLFSCYASDSQEDIQFYVPKPATPPTPVENWTEGVRTGLTEGWYYTMCLEQEVTNVQGATIWRVLSKAANGNDVILEEAALPLAAGRPYIFRASAAQLDVVYTGDAVDDPVNDVDNNGLIGSFTGELIAQSPNNYIIWDNALYYVNSGNVSVGAHRAYLDMTGVPAYNPGAGAPRRRVVMTVHGEQNATGMENVQGDNVQCTKVLIDGNIYILRGEKLYDATGRLVK